jgi:hypothetical protein
LQGVIEDWLEVGGRVGRRAGERHDGRVLRALRGDEGPGVVNGPGVLKGLLSETPRKRHLTCRHLPSIERAQARTNKAVPGHLAKAPNSWLTSPVTHIFTLFYFFQAPNNQTLDAPALTPGMTRMCVP